MSNLLHVGTHHFTGHHPQLTKIVVRQREYALKPLYTKRQKLLEQIPDFWPTVLGNAPDEIAQCFTEADLAILACVKSLWVERHEIESDTKGDPRSLRFVFEFNKNDFLEDTRLIKEFTYRPSDQGPGNLVSTPVPVKWTNKKTDPTQGALDLANELYRAEETLKAEKKDLEIDSVERESLWAYEKLREKLDNLAGEQHSFFNWFGYRGAVARFGRESPESTDQNGDSGKAVDGEGGGDSQIDDDVDETLDVEVFPGGDDVAISLADDLWSSVIDYFSECNSQDNHEP